MTDNEAKRVIGDNIGRYRGDMSLGALARACETSTIQISRIARGMHMPGVGLLTRIADALRVTPNDLLTPLDKKSRKRA
jgi:transcriptional regulator with XRE-family HTH domain